MKKILKDNENRIVLSVMALVFIVAISPLISRYCINGHDLEYHLLRIEALKENILIGRPFLKVNPLFFGGAGYASSMFYSDFLLYIPAIMRAVGVSINASYHIFVAICTLLCMLSSYYCAYKMSGSKYTGLVAAILLTLCPYHMDDLMVRAAVGEYMAFIFVPFVIYGIYNVLYEDMDKPWILAAGFGGVLLSHTATTAMCIVFTVAAFLIKIKTFIKKPNIIIRLALTACVTALVTAIYWLPMLEQFATARFNISSGGGIDMLDAAVDFSKVLSQDFPTIGVFLLLPTVFRFFVSREDDTTIEYADWMLIGGAAFCLLSTNIMPWEYLSRVLSFVQFPWRFFLIASVLFAFADAILIKCYVEKIWCSNREDKNYSSSWSTFIIVTFMIMSSSALAHQSVNAQGYYDYSNDYYSYKPYTCNVIGGEWIPETVEDFGSILEDSEKMVASDGASVDFSRENGKVLSTVNEEYEYIDVPFIYYKGYSAQIQNESGQKQKLQVDASGNNGFCRVYTQGTKGLLTVNYTGTALLYVSYILTILGFVLTGWYIKKTKSIKLRGENQ